MRIAIERNDGIAEFLVPGRDGGVVRCAVERLGDEQIRHWMFRDPAGNEYIGPVWSPVEDLHDLDALVAEWCVPPEIFL